MSEPKTWTASMAAKLAEALRSGKKVRCSCCRRSWKVRGDGFKQCGKCRDAGCVHLFDFDWRRGEKCPRRVLAQRNGKNGGRPKQ